MTPFKKYWSKLEAVEKKYLSDELDTSADYLEQIANGHREPGLDLAKRMEKITGIPRLKLKPSIFDWLRT